MDLMTLAAKITLDDSSYTKGIKNAENMGQQLAGKMSAMTVAVGNIAADVIRKSVSAISGVISSAVDGYANYQQLVGGVETLFKSSAGKVQKYAEQAYKTAGLSANAYMETVTSFSASLLQGLGGDTEAAAEMANTAIMDMADNANKMGTDMSSIQAAYQGFAKQNYTMLDNLKLGYGGTAGEMVRLINDSKILDHEIENLDGITFDQLVQAIHVVQTNLGITGTTAKEAADTISGSKSSLAAAWQDLLVAVTGTDQEKTDWWNDPLNESVKKFQESFSTYIENIVPALVQTVSNSGTLVNAIADAIGDLPTDLLSKIATEGLESGTEMVGAVSKITHWLIESLADMFRNVPANAAEIADFGRALGDFLGTTIGDLVKYAPDIITDIIQVGASLAGGLVQGLFEGLFGKGAEVDKITEQLQDDLTDIELDNAQATGILRYMDKLYEKYGNGVTRMAEWKEAQKQLEESMPGAGKVFDDYGKNIEGALKTLDKLNESMRRTAIISGMQKAMHDMEELYGEQLGRQTVAETAAGIAGEQLESAKGVLIESLRAYAAEWADMNARNEFVTADEKAAAEQMALHGRVYNPGTGEYEYLQNLPVETLLSNLQYYFNDLDLAGRNVWDRSSMDKVEDLDTIMRLSGQITKYEQTIEENNQKAQEAAKEAQATWEQIQITQIALDNAIAHQSDGYGKATDDVTEGGAQVEDALTGVAAKIAAIRIPSHLTPVAYDYMPEDTGLDFIPYNGFRASLHRGEAIITASENAQRRSGAGNADVVEAIQGLRNDMRNLQLVVGEKSFGRAVVNYGANRVDSYIGQAEDRAASGYGG